MTYYAASFPCWVNSTFHHRLFHHTSIKIFVCLFVCFVHSIAVTSRAKLLKSLDQCVTSHGSINNSATLTVLCACRRASDRLRKARTYTFPQFCFSKAPRAISFYLPCCDHAHSFAAALTSPSFFFF